MFVPTRRGAGDAEIIAWALALSTILWGIASALLLLVTIGVNGIGAEGLRLTGWHVQLWDSWLRPALTLREIRGTDIVPGLILSCLGAFIGAVIAGLMRVDGGHVRRLGEGKLGVDQNARVWSWFLHAASRGQIYRVRLKSGLVLIGQISEYSSDPGDDVQEIVMQGYSRMEDGELTAVTDSVGAIISRDDIEIVERMPYTVLDLERRMAES